ncbi:MAG: porin [Pseudomonadales bacterium]|nr:porin [Pseudomonadales bacterium]
MSVVTPRSVLVLAALAMALEMITVPLRAGPLRYSASITGQFADVGGNDLAVNLGITTSSGYSFNGYASRSDTRAAAATLEPLYWSATIGKRFGPWSASLGYRQFDDGLQVATEDFLAQFGWLSNRGSVAFTLVEGSVVETYQIITANRNVPITVATDRTGLGVSGDFDLSERLTINAGVRRYRYADPRSPVAGLPRLQALLRSNVFTAQQGLVDLIWNGGASWRFSRLSLSADFARSRWREDGAESDDLFVALDMPLTQRWTVSLGGGRFTAPDFDPINYGAVTVRFSGP